MANLPLLADVRALPQASDSRGVERGFERLSERAEQCQDAALAAFTEELGRDAESKALLEALFGNSPYLAHCLLSDLAFFRSLAERGLDAGLASVLAALQAPSLPLADRAGVMSQLRAAKRQSALVIGLADMVDAWPLERVTAALTDFAEASLDAALRHLLLAAAEAGEIGLKDEAAPGRGSGLAILGVGKLGGRELNFSSDIDLFLLYDEEIVDYRGPDGCQKGLVRLVRELLRMLEERTSEGYVFRTDLRLRPDPGATPIIMSMGAAEAYYESVGQNWERAAMIKARPVAGDRQAGAAFLERLVPFIWRRHLDFAAIEDIHSIKRQIHAHRGHHRIAVAGHDIKLGRGGIREIELFAQTQQLIWGGRDSSLRSASTCEALRALAQAGRIDRSTADELTASYRFLRRLEHRLQMVADEQTHKLPEDSKGLEAIALFMGYEGREAFVRDYTVELMRVERYYAELFEKAPDLSAPGNLVFTGEEDDPETLETLARFGFRDGAAVSAIIRGWHRGRVRSTRSKRAREILTELVPALLSAFGETLSPDAAFMRFHEFLAKLPAGVQLFSLFHTNPSLLDLLAGIMGSAPRLAEHLRRKPALLEAVLSADFFLPLPSAGELATDLEQGLEQARNFEDVLDITRRWAHDREFRVGVQILRNRIKADDGALALSNVADAVLAVLQPRVEAEFARTHGRVPGGALATVALGKLGGREMTTESDLDLVFIYQAPNLLEPSDGPKPMPASQYFTRLCQRLINALAAPTSEGVLYLIDMRLRPSGHAGPLASEIGAFADYQRSSAWTWEHMALTRARVVAGPQALKERIEALFREVLTQPRDPESLRADVASIRGKILAERGTANPWRLKHVRGGLLDLDFLAQFLELSVAAERPEVLQGSTAGAFVKLGEAGVLDPELARELAEATRLLRRLQGLLRLTVGTAREEENFPEGLCAALAEAAGAVDFSALRETLMEVERRVHGHFVRLIEAP